MENLIQKKNSLKGIVLISSLFGLISCGGGGGTPSGHDSRLDTPPAGQEITEGRQHYLRFSVPETWQNWEDAGLKVDSSMNYAGYEGYRCGTASAFPVFNVKTRRQLKLLERPMVLMDTNPIMHNFNDISKDYKEVNSYFIEKSRLYAMPLTVLFHNSVFSMYQKQGIENAYTNLLGKV